MIYIPKPGGLQLTQRRSKLVDFLRSTTAKWLGKTDHGPNKMAPGRIDSFADKSLPKPPSRMHSFHYGFAFLDHRAENFTGKTQGYHFGASFSAAVTAIVLVSNLVIFAYEASQNRGSFGVALIQEGNCNNTKNLATWLHLIINILSTGLLGCSNYTMQCLASPTRKEINKAHQQGTWMEIGVPSLTNLARISKQRLALWILLGLSSIPLHLLYNSVVFSTLASREYSAYTVTQAFLDGAPFNSSNIPIDGVSPAPLGLPPPNDTDSRLNYLLLNRNSLQRMDNKACLTAYSSDIISKYGDLLLVSSQNEANNSVLELFPDNSPGFASSAHGPADWTGSKTSTSKGGKQWRVHGNDILYCLVQREDEHCKLQFSVGMMFVVVVCNAVKVVCMLWIAKRRDDLEPLATIGDAVASFLEEPDKATLDHCLADRKTFKTAPSWNETTTRYQPKKGVPRWFTAVGRGRWIATNTVCLLTLVAVLGLLLLGTSNEGVNGKSSISALWNQGFGTVTSSQIISSDDLGTNSLIAMVLLSNFPQLLLSGIYIAFNCLMTYMLVGREWNNYSLVRKPLRVTSPKGQQCSTYYLQLPYRYAVPLLIVSGLLHWLVSQSIFLAAVDIYDHYGVLQPKASISTCGYSCISIIFVLIVGSLVPISVFATAWQKYKGLIPLAGCNSAAIAAACHPPEFEKNTSTLPVKWGDVGGRTYDYASGQKGIIRHCSFSSGAVSPPVDGELYS